jgi:hypothetical protein
MHDTTSTTPTLVWLSQAQLDVLQEVMFSISTESADPVHAATEFDGDGVNYKTPEGRVFCLRPIVDEDTFHAFEDVVGHLEGQLRQAAQS